MKVLFIAHATRFSNSLFTHIRNSDVEADLITDRPLLGSMVNAEYAIKALGSRLKNIYAYILPVCNCYIGKSTEASYYFIYKIKQLLYPFSKIKINNIIKNGNYSYIHLNSLVLHKLINTDYPFIIHIRERYDGTDPSIFSSLAKAAGVVFIDNAAYSPFRNFHINHKIILNNPVDMKPDTTHILKQNIDTSKTIFSVVGRIEEDKGIFLIIDAFKEAKMKNSILLIVGSGKTDDIYKSMNIALGYDNIIFYGPEDNIQIIYDITDYVVRGENEQCVGRTMYEGLYSGCEVIVPGDNVHAVFEYDKFAPMIHFYKPLSMEELVQKFKNFDGKKITNRVYGSNVKEYIQKFNAFVEQCLK